MDLRGAEGVEFGEAGMVGPGDVVPGEVVVSAEVDPVVESSEVIGVGGVGMEGPGDQDIEKSVEGCRHCQELLPSKVKEMMISKPTPEQLFQNIAVDFASYGGRQFLTILDCMTNWPDIGEIPWLGSSPL